ncbi:hypothetical protein SAMN02745166_03858 [Prosthecobacter debontii]|uniref:Uncharacterized protein n=1 Tax=Prosthecobacter debontii TaxID=48467 RepID=A0A1T4YPG8_9BACT|nr:hypothetical protein [Prosthecobacter debontii]SKB03620.1 hypothetical protein SAMN02745166_03858 [Prosthecobacter debontii]
MPEEPSPWTDVAGKAFDDAKRLFKDGHYSEALERHEWFHEHALEFKSSYYGVRLSYALRHWKELADVYPPAMDSLISIRDRDTQRLLDGNGSPQLLHDVDSMNDALEQTDATLALFRRLETAHPELARQSFAYIDRLCLRSDPALFRRHCSDPVSFYRQQRESYFRSTIFLRERGCSDNSEQDEARLELRELAAQIIKAFSEDSDIASKVSRLESTTDDELTRRLE